MTLFKLNGKLAMKQKPDLVTHNWYKVWHDLLFWML